MRTVTVSIEELPAPTWRAPKGIDTGLTAIAAGISDPARRVRAEERLRRALPGVEVRGTGANLGYTGGINAGFRIIQQQQVAIIPVADEPGAASEEVDFLRAGRPEQHDARHVRGNRDMHGQRVARLPFAVHGDVVLGHGLEGADALDEVVHELDLPRVQGHLDVLEDRLLLENPNIGNRDWFAAGWQRGRKCC